MLYFRCMIKYLFLLLSLFSFLLPNPIHAAEPVYASAVIGQSSNVLTPTNALGAADNLFADFRSADASLTLDMGADMSGDLTIIYRIFDVGATARVEFLDGTSTELQTTTEILALHEDAFTVSYTAATPYRYVRITEVESETWSVDAVSTTPTSDTTTEEPVTEEPPTIEDTTGQLVKSSSNSAVYVLGSDGKRHAFPNEAIFYTWYADFESVSTIDEATLASYKLGKNVPVRPGTYLVKLTTDPKTYAVEPGGVLRWVTSESVATELYGADWAHRVLDLSDTMWPNYTVGDNVTTTVHPDGTIIADGAVRWYITNGSRFEISTSDFTALEFADTFLITDAQDALDVYVDGGDLELSDEVQYPF